MNNIKERIKIFSGAQLKYIAFLSMLIDHTNKALIYPNLDGGALNRLSDFFDILGRIAFPIFIFLLVEGYFHTKNKWKYLITLLVWSNIRNSFWYVYNSYIFWSQLEQYYVYVSLGACHDLADWCTQGKDGSIAESFMVFRIISHCGSIVLCCNESGIRLWTPCGADWIFLLYFSWPTGTCDSIFLSFHVQRTVGFAWIWPDTYL